MFRKTLLVVIALSTAISVAGCKTDFGGDTGKQPDAPTIITDDDPDATGDQGVIGDNGVESDDQSNDDQTKAHPNLSKPAGS